MNGALRIDYMGAGDEIAGSMEPDTNPITRHDLNQAFNQAIDRAIEAILTAVHAEVKAAEERAQEFARGIETNLLSAFHGHAKGQNARLQ